MFDLLEKNKIDQTKRPSEMPEFFQDELLEGHEYPKTFKLNHSVELQYRRTNWLKFCLEYDFIQYRKYIGWIMIDGERVGAVHFNEFKLTELVGNFELYDAMDSMGTSDATMINVLASNWVHIGEDVFANGTLLELSLIWMDPKKSDTKCKWAELIKAFIEKRIPNQALMILEACPFEVINYDEKFLRKQKALIRHYKKVLNMNLFDGWPGETGWMWSLKEKNPYLQIQPHFREKTEIDDYWS